ncbi:MAG: hypothetical protein GAK35_04208 [Herbaspirillum frisingense]|uniref:Nicotinamide riboside transporter PnuC n=1 Tax=Herbaspirillum frisingense TaxID=92645 RepID=A0A7V8FSS5_9BURK|nr:MAG: hypothetical protein GAK35_04208 [Herbaspirillum frisingense]
MENFSHWMEAVGAVSGLLGAWLIAFKCRYSRWAFFIYLCSNSCWLAFAVLEHHVWMQMQMVGFAVSSMVGIWNYWIVPLGASRAAKLE